MKYPPGSKPKRARSTVFFIPNNDEGRAWLKQARLYLNRKHWKLRPRGRGPRQTQGHNKQFLPLALSTYFGLYLNSPTADELSRKEWSSWYKELSELRAQLKAAKQPAEQKKVENLQRLVNLFYRKRAISLVN
jgi:hypothetical protein